MHILSTKRISSCVRHQIIPREDLTGKNILGNFQINTGNPHYQPSLPHSAQDKLR